MKSSYNSTEVKSSLHLALLFCINLMYSCTYLVYNFHFYFMSELIPNPCCWIQIRLLLMS